jgi:pimeloyl-ACP methyl ester carboxylesterase
VLGPVHFAPARQGDEDRDDRDAPNDMSDQPTPADRFRTAQARLLVAMDVRATSRMVRSQDRWTHVIEAGSGRPVLLVHGGDSVAGAWLPLFAQLRDGYHLFAPDRPGSGLTRWPVAGRLRPRERAVEFLLTLLDTLDLPRVNLVGSSMGGYWALAFALAHPERVQRLALLGAPSGSAQRPRLRDRLLAVPGLGGLAHAAAWPGGRAAVRGRLARAVAHPERLPDPLVDLLSAGARLRGVEQAALEERRAAVPALGAARLTYALRGELGGLRLPVLVAWGERDRCPVRWGEELCAALPDARLEVVPDAGHLVWLDEPQATAGLLGGFLDASARLSVRDG